MSARDVRRMHAIEARRVVEMALDTRAWAWSPRLSRWLDMLVTIEEQER